MTIIIVIGALHSKQHHLQEDRLPRPSPLRSNQPINQLTLHVRELKVSRLTLRASMLNKRRRMLTRRRLGIV